MKKHETEHDKFMRDIHRIDIILRNHQIATIIECKRPNFDSPNPDYAEVKFQAKNAHILEMIIQFINEKSEKYGGQVAARIIENDEVKEYLMVLVPCRGVPRERWAEESFTYLNRFTSAVKDYQQKYKKPA